MRPIGSAKSLEKRRRQAVELSKAGKGIREIARKVLASPGAVHRWLQDWMKHGEDGLSAKSVPGRPKKLSTHQRKKLQKCLLAGAMACGFPNELWTLERIASVVRRQFGVRHHPSHLWRILQSCGWSCQVPEKRALQRDEAAIAHWQRYKYPAIKKSPKTWGPHRLPR